MKYSLIIGYLLILIVPGVAADQPTITKNTSHAFIENKGQIIDQRNEPNSAVIYLLNTPGMNVQLRRGGFSYDLYRITKNERRTSIGKEPESGACHQPSCIGRSISKIEFNRIDFNLIGSNPNCEVLPSHPSPGYFNYYTTGTTEKGVTWVHSYYSITYKNIYPKIDLVFYSDDDQGFKYNFVVHPGGDLTSIILKISDPEISLNSRGSLVFITTIGTVEENIPKSFSIGSAGKIDVKVSYIKLGDGLYGFVLNKEIPANCLLVIDPIPTRIWGTYYGGSGDGEDFFGSVKLDIWGNVIVSGLTNSVDNIASSGAHQTTYAGNQDAVLVRFNSSGGRIWSTYYGGSEGEWATKCAVDNGGNIYLSGYTLSDNNIATPGSHQAARDSLEDAYLAKFDTNGVRLWGTYYGGKMGETGGDCATDNFGNVYLVGGTNSATGISTAGSYQPVKAAAFDGYLVKFNSTGVRLWGTYYGGNSIDDPSTLEIADNGTIYFGGETESISGIASPGAFQTVQGGSWDGFLVAMNSSGQRLWATYYGGIGWDCITSIAISNSGFLCFSGFTRSSDNIASLGAFQTNFQGETDAMVAKFNIDGTRQWGSYYGGSGTDYSWGCNINSTGCAFLAGYTNSVSGISTPSGYQPAISASLDGFLAKFLPSGQRTWGTYYGGNGSTQLNAVYTDPTDYLYVCGGTGSQTNMVTAGAWQTILQGSNDALLVKFKDCSSPDFPGPIIGNAAVCVPSDEVYNISPLPFVTGYQWTVPTGAFITAGQNTNSITVSFSVAATPGPVTVMGINDCANGPLDTLFVSMLQRTTPNLQGDTIACAGVPSTFFVDPGKSQYQWTISSGGTVIAGGIPSSDSITIMWNTVGNNWVKVSFTDTNGCSSFASRVDLNVSNGNPVGVSVIPSSNPSCSGENVTFTATPVNGGTMPAYQWQVNGLNVGANLPTYTYNPASGDLVSCVLTSSEICTTNNPASSIAVIVTVNPILPVSVGISASLNPICGGLPVTFTAIPGNGGANPSYQWKVNGVNAGSNQPAFTYNPASGDLVSCVLTSSELCTTNNPASSNQISMNVITAPVVTFTVCFDTITTLNAKPINLKGGIPLGGSYTGPGVTLVTGVFTPSIAGLGSKTITYTYTNAGLCSASKTRKIVVQPAPAFACGNNLVDIRDNKSYPTVQLGGQCWFASDLDYGIQIPENIHQRDNCISEKYLNPVSGIWHPASYQWDELMLYDPAPGLQGLCPPAWHIPTEADWNTLFGMYISNGFAGSPLKYSGYSGFNALLSGARHETVQWDYQNFAVFFWSSDSHGPYRAWAHGMNDPDPSVSVYPSLRSNAFSVRCIRD